MFSISQGRTVGCYVSVSSLDNGEIVRKCYLSHLQSKARITVPHHAKIPCKLCKKES